MITRERILLGMLGWIEIRNLFCFLSNVYTSMSSVYFPAHVVVLFKRLINVVSTLSISNQYVLYTQAKAKVDSSETPRTSTTIRDGLNAVRNDPSRSLHYLKDVEWTRWMHRRLWNRGLLVGGKNHSPDVVESRNEVNSETLLKGLPGSSFIG